MNRSLAARYIRFSLRQHLIDWLIESHQWNINQHARKSLISIYSRYCSSIHAQCNSLGFKNDSHCFVDLDELSSNHTFISRANDVQHTLRRVKVCWSAVILPRQCAFEPQQTLPFPVLFSEQFFFRFLMVLIKLNSSLILIRWNNKNISRV